MSKRYAAVHARPPGTSTYQTLCGRYVRSDQLQDPGTTPSTIITCRLCRRALGWREQVDTDLIEMLDT